ncbi:hypothetical protein EJK54_0341 [Moraxella catarrhalis]|uniref:Uncharacterized protein n=1 Tax=Moraxella catarrhalis TaxID=480 RepID=A0ABY0BII2_MORCA|nr:hypothetical protein EJK54_0341 [Moraxella catarrhalis]
MVVSGVSTKNLGIFDQLNDLNQTQISDQCRIGLGVSDMLNNKAGMLFAKQSVNIPSDQNDKKLCYAVFSKMSKSYYYSKI